MEKALEGLRPIAAYGTSRGWLCRGEVQRDAFLLLSAI